MRAIDYHPRNIRETLVELKDSSELAVDLSYSAILFDTDEMAREVIDLEERVHFLQYHARIALMLAAKNATDAESMVGIFQIVDGAVAVTRAAGDIAQVQLRELGVPPAFRALPDAHEEFVRVVIPEGASVEGSRLDALALDVEAGIRVIAIRRETDWVFDPGGADRLLAGDVVFASGPAEGVQAFHLEATGELPPDHPLEEGEGLRDAIETLVELKNISELAIGLAYGAALYDSDPMADEVRVLERRADGLREEVERWVVTAIAEGETESVDALRGLFHVAFAAEVICDAALAIAEVVFRDVALHPVYAQAIAESEEMISSVEITGTDLAGTPVGGLAHRADGGLSVLALHRADRWLFDPADDLPVRIGDRLVLTGPADGHRRLRDLAG